MENKSFLDYFKQQKTNKFKSSKEQLRQQYYGSVQWRNLSSIYKMQHPLCELCLLEGKTSPAEEVHHIQKWNDQKSPELKAMLLLDKDNIISLCKDCHQHIHKKAAELTDKQQQFLREQKTKIMEKYLLNGIIISITDDNNFSGRKKD